MERRVARAERADRLRCGDGGRAVSPSPSTSPPSPSAAAAAAPGAIAAAWARCRSALLEPAAVPAAARLHERALVRVLRVFWRPSLDATPCTAISHGSESALDGATSSEMPAVHGTRTYTRSEERITVLGSGHVYTYG